MKQIARIALLSVTLFSFLVLGNYTVRAENQSDSEPKVQRSTKKKPQLRLATAKKQKKKAVKKKVKNTHRIADLRKTWARNRAKQTRQSQRAACINRNASASTWRSRRYASTAGCRANRSPIAGVCVTATVLRRCPEKNRCWCCVFRQRGQAFISRKI